jgi:polyhydroxyalkanoate synthase
MPPRGKMPAMQTPPPPTSRTGPRPLWLHQQTALLTYQSLRLLWPVMAQGSMPWHPKLQSAGKKWQQKVKNLKPPARAALDAALEQQLIARLDDFKSGIDRYHAQPPSRRADHYSVIATVGSTRLLGYGQARPDAPPILLIPSLVNRFYILDLYPGCSLLEFLCRQGYSPYVIDWAEPGDAEAGFTLDDYQTRILTMAQTLSDQWQRKLHIAGYCMGGVFAIALAQLRPKTCQSLMLLATPWDFTGMGMSRDKIENFCTHILPLFAQNGLVPVDLLQAMFFEREPFLVIEKFIHLSRRQDLAHFTALEDWLNDGVPLSAPVMEQCLTQWYGDNRLANGQFLCLGKKLRPGRIKIPTLSVIPKTDRIVPKNSAMALARSFPKHKTILADTGHIGIVTSKQQQTALWPKIATWLHKTESL